ncbi:phosphatase PAP2 family protein [Sphingomonas lutea]|uniref:Phosphatase PAP2 family protein n=1 Tax=Sphingomonas lutea TaxID=1045317 RepID=A0A7G9SJ99_9SPHN|nr:phosphatase PAP2 family protein [Sphingomonas lutea]QNN67924.1 phosphatase PAP2 family protein [Sphingomonas lutea]
MRDQDWMALAVRLIAIQIVGGVILAFSLGFAQEPPLLVYAASGFAFSVITVGVFILIDTYACWRENGASALSYIVAGLQRRKHKLRLAGAGLTLAIVQLTILTWTKGTLPLVQDFWADPYLAEFDRMILGTDAFRLAQLLPGGALIDRHYNTWFPWLAVVFTMNLFRDPSDKKSQAALSFFLTFALVGVLGMFLMPSGGPIFYERLGYGDQFAGLNPPQISSMASDYLWAKHNHLVVDVASGISAMPSMHIAMAMWTYLTLMSISRRAGVVGAIYGILILFGSVYLGWHYLSDGIAGALGALGCWHLARVPNRRRVDAQDGEPVTVLR